MGTTHVDPSRAATELAGGIRRRVGALVVASTLAVALVFGMSFYFALVSNESAIAAQVPELAPVAAKMRSLLFVNTLIFAGVIVVSFAILARIVTARLFRSLGAVRSVLAGMSQGKLPHAADLPDGGPFSPIVDALRDAASGLRQGDERAAAELGEVASMLDAIPAAAAAAKRVREIAAKQLGVSQAAGPEKQAAERDPLFIQPV